MTRKRKQYTGEEKLALLRQHLLEGVAVKVTPIVKILLAKSAGGRPSVGSSFRLMRLGV